MRLKIGYVFLQNVQSYKLRATKMKNTGTLITLAHLIFTCPMDPSCTSSIALSRQIYISISYSFIHFRALYIKSFDLICTHNIQHLPKFKAFLIHRDNTSLKSEVLCQESNLDEILFNCSDLIKSIEVWVVLITKRV